MLVRNGTLPRIVQNNERTQTLGIAAPVADIILFNTQAQLGQAQRLLAWVSFPRNAGSRAQPLEFHLPRNVTTRFVTAVMIEPENYLEQDGDDDIHPVPNVDVQGIVFSGKKIKVPTQILQNPHPKYEAVPDRQQQGSATTPTVP